MLEEALMALAAAGETAVVQTVTGISPQAKRPAAGMTTC